MTILIACVRLKYHTAEQTALYDRKHIETPFGVCSRYIQPIHTVTVDDLGQTFAELLDADPAIRTGL